MKHKSAKIALSALIVFSLGTTEAGTLRKVTKGTFNKTRNLAITQVRGAMSAVAQATDMLMYPVLCYMVGKHVYDEHLQQYAPDTPKLVTDIEDTLPDGHGRWAHDKFIRLVAGCVVIAGGHALIHTELVGGFVDENMPRLSRLLNHISGENGLRVKTKKTKAANAL